MKYLPIFRKICQIAVLALFCALPFLATLDFAGIRGSLFSLDFFGIPFADPASTLHVAGQSALAGVLPSAEVLLGAAFSLLLAFFLGRVFCSWLCPYGFLSELAAGKRKNWKHAQRLKIAVFIGAFILAALAGWPLITWISLPGQLSLAPMAFGGDRLLALSLLLAPIIALLLDAFSRRRFFCAAICPQSLLLGLSAKLLPKKIPGLRLTFNARKCSCRQRLCEKACQFALLPRKNPDRGQCVMCGDCVATCAKTCGALRFTGKPDSAA